MKQHNPAFIFILTVTLAFAINAAEGKGLAAEYAAVEKANRADQEYTDEIKQKRLKGNIFRAIRATLLRRIYDPQEKAAVQQLKSDAVQFERVEKSFVYYAKVSGKYYFKFHFRADPRVFIQDPARIWYENSKGNIKDTHPEY